MQSNNVLVIDDERDLLDSLQIVLQMHGFKPFLAENVQKGLDLLAQQPIDIILCDVSLPDMSGLEALATIKSNADWSTIPFIFITAMADKEDIKLGLEAGADKYITKPFSSKELILLIKSYIVP